MRRLATRVAIAAILFASGAASVAPPASARSLGPLAGSWTSVDTDGSNQTLRIKGAGNPVYAVFLRDDVTSGACGGPPAKLVGHAVADGDALFVRGTLVCLHGGNPIPGVHVRFDLEYDAASDTLVDPAGVVWERAG